MRERFKFKEGATLDIGSENFWYALTSGGYIHPEYLLEDEDQLKELMIAIGIVRDFQIDLHDEGFLDEC